MFGRSLANGTAYSANDPSLLAWVHVTEAMSFLGAWIRLRRADHASATDQDRYFTEVARIASALGANPVPQSRAEADEVVQLMKPYLLCDKRTRQIAHHAGASAPDYHAGGTRTDARSRLREHKTRNVRTKSRSLAGACQRFWGRSDTALGLSVMSDFTTGAFTANFDPP